MGISKYYGFWEAVFSNGIWYFSGPFFNTLGFSSDGNYKDPKLFLAPGQESDFLQFIRSFSDARPNAVLEQECHWVTAKGEEIPTYISGQVTATNAENGPVKINFYTRETTMLSMLPERVQLAHEQFQNAFEHSAIGMALVSPEGAWLKVNKQVSEITGYSEFSGDGAVWV
ncbi:MAG: PAS domain S-box protein [Owenweeksia sp.]